MPQLTAEHLFFVLIASLGAPALGRRAWGLWRALFGALYLLWFDSHALVAILAASGLAFLGGGLQPRWSRALRAAGLLAIVGTFVVVRLNAPSEGGEVLAPVGFAFLLLRLTHYWIERRDKRLPEHTFWDLFGWLSYLPTVLVGPVQRFDDWLLWERRHRFDPADAAWGLRRILFGYFKLVVVAYTLCGERLADLLVGLPAVVSVTITNLLVLYFSFAGLSDMAIGLGRMWGQRVPENFSSPFLQPTLPRFWQSWHITVGSFCRTYVYLPILAGTRRPILAAAAAIAVFALWHEPKLPFLAWGAWHGLGVYGWRRLPSVEESPGWRLLSTLLTWAWVLVGFAGLSSWPQGGAWWMR